MSDETIEEYKTSLDTVMKFLRGDNIEKSHTPIVSSVRTLKAQTIAPGGIEMIVASMDDTFELHSALITSTDEQVNNIVMNSSMMLGSNDPRRSNKNDLKSTSNSEQIRKKFFTFDSYLPLKQHGRTSSISSTYEKCSCDLCCILEENYADIHDERKENEISLQQIKHMESNDSDKINDNSHLNMDNADEKTIDSFANINESKTHHITNAMCVHADNILADLFTDTDEYPMIYIHKSGPSRHTIYSFLKLSKLPIDYSFYEPISIMFDKNSGKLTPACAKNFIEV
uniref:ERCC4 domain-containing protein n=1 Tax=Ascaris lumbricoides TaxID=6252 RepID=A0A0M3HIA4_ASCLU